MPTNGVLIALIAVCVVVVALLTIIIWHQRSRRARARTTTDQFWVHRPDSIDPQSEPADVAAPAQTLVLEQEGPRLVAWLIRPYSSPRNRIDQVRLQDMNHVGREIFGNEIVVDDRRVSRRHAVIRLEEGGYVIQDLASSNGTYVNNSKILKSMLVDGDLITVGTVTFVFKQVDLS